MTISEIKNPYIRKTATVFGVIFFLFFMVLFGFCYAVYKGTKAFIDDVIPEIKAFEDTLKNAWNGKQDEEKT